MKYTKWINLDLLKIVIIIIGLTILKKINIFKCYFIILICMEYPMGHFVILLY